MRLANICALNEEVDEWQVLTRKPLTGRALWLHGQPKAWARPLVFVVRGWLRMKEETKEAISIIASFALFILMVVSFIVAFG